MKKYRCIKSLWVDHYLDNGFPDERQVEIKPGEEFEVSNSSYRFCGGRDSVRLERGYVWLEIERETLEEFFKEVND